MHREEIEIHSHEEIKLFEKRLPLGQSIRIKKATLRKEFASLNIDFFKIGRLSSDWIISERLKKALEAAEITGVEFKEATNIAVEN